MFALTIFLTIILSFLYFRFKKQYSYWKNLGVPQSDFSTQINDQLRLFFGLDHISTRNKKIYEQFPNAKYVGYYQTLNRCILLKDIELIKKIFVKDFDSFINRALLLDIDADPLFYRSLGAIEGQEWKETRKLLSPLFTGSKLKEMFNLVEEHAKNYVKFLINKQENVLEWDVTDLAARFATDVTANCTYGVKIDSINCPDNEFFMTGQHTKISFDFKRLFKLAMYNISPFIYKLLGCAFFSKTLSAFLRNLTDEVIKIKEKGNIRRNDILQLLLEARKSLKNDQLKVTNDDMTSHIFLFFLGSLETLTSALTFLLYELASNPEVQDKLRKEIEETSEMFEGEVNYQVLTKMNYMNMVVSESLRRRPSMSFVMRKCIKTYKLDAPFPEGKPVTIEPGTIINVPLYSLLNDPKHFPDPLKFDPERHSEENKSKIHQYTNAYFGIGPRNCIGSRFAIMKIKCFIFNFLKNFEIISVGKTAAPMEFDPKAFSLYPKNKLILGFKRICK